MIKATISLDRGWGERMARQIERHIPRLVAEAAEDGAGVASQESQSRRNTGRMAQMDVLPVVKTPRGFTGGFRSRAFYAGFQSAGTLGSRSRRVSAATERRRASGSGQARLARLGSSPGIAPLGFLEKGRAAMRRSLAERINRLT